MSERYAMISIKSDAYMNHMFVLQHRLCRLIESRMHPQEQCKGGGGMDCVAVVEQMLTLLRQPGRMTSHTRTRHFQLDNEGLEACRGNASIAST
jgi:hypothetical protein